MRLLMMCVVFIATFFVLSRTQVNEHARLFIRGSQVELDGTVRRDFLSGDFIVITADGVEHHVPQEQFGGMVYEGSSLSPVAVWAAAFALVSGLLLTILWPLGQKDSRNGAPK